MGLSKIRIGVYGAAASGKTSFWRQLVQRNNIPVAPGSKLSQFIISSIGPDGKILPTTAAIENLDLRLDGTSFLVGDGPGNLLAESVDQLDLERRSKNPIVRQIAQSDAFFFFFDSSAGQHPRELLRAKQLIDYALETRQNRLLPILFILTHRDSADQTGPAQLWIDEVADHLEESYSRILSGYYPHSLIQKENVFYQFSPVQPKQGDESARVLRQARSLVDLVRRFRQKDRKRTRRLISTFLLCGLLVLMLPILCLSSPTVQRVLFHLRSKTAPVLEQLPSLSGEMSVGEIDLSPLQVEKKPIDEETASSLNRSLFILMKRLNTLEDAGEEKSEEYQARLKDWNEAFDTLDKRFDSVVMESQKDRQKKFTTILTSLGDSPARTTEALNSVLKKYWTRTRWFLAEDLHEEIAIHREANTPSSQILDELCKRLEKAFRDVSESRVRGNQVSDKENETNQKEQLKQDIRKVFIACRNYMDRYPVEIKIQSASYDSEDGIDRDYDRRLVFSGGKEKSDVYIDLTISSGFQNETSCDFLPSRKDLTVSFVLDHPLLLTLQQKKKGSQGEWEKISGWEMSSESRESVSLQALGILFYLRFENDENTSYPPEGKGFKFDLSIRRPRSVPEFLWEIVEGVSSTD